LNSNLQHPQAAREAWNALAALQPDAPRTRAMDILLLRREGRDSDAAAQLHRYFDQGTHDYDLVRFAMAIGLEKHDQALAVQAYRLWVTNWPAEVHAQAEALALAPAAWRAEMQRH
jgi:cell division FtsZ-interacting protein ZapD